MSKLDRFRNAVPHLPEWHETGMCMDIRHIAMLASIANIGGWRNALEIGVWNGCSTAAFIPALINRKVEHYSACDIRLKERFRRVIGRVNPDYVTLHEMSSVECLAGREPHDLVVVDGDHSLPTVATETDYLLALPSLRCVVAHDTNATKEGYKECEGAAHLAYRFAEAGWSCVEDKIDRRPLEQTRRGFFVAIRPGDDDWLIDKVRDIFAAFTIDP